MQKANREFMNHGRMPVLFVGHGSPLNSLEDNHWSRSFRALSGKFPKPTGILAISAHWYVDGSFVTGNSKQKTIHDFGGFPQALYKIQYPALGNAELADQVCKLLSEYHASISFDWGLDHGTWSVLRWMYPKADVPVIQLSINQRLNVAQHLALARSLQPLRDLGVLIVGSGNIVHNLQDAFSQKRMGTFEVPDWAKRFDETVLEVVERYQTRSLLNLISTEDGRMSHPTLDHWLPLIYSYGAADEGETVIFPIEGFDWGSLSMRSIIFGNERGGLNLEK